MSLSMGSQFTNWYISRQYHLAISRLDGTDQHAVMHVREIRKLRVKQLINDEFNQNKAKFARAIGRSPQEVGRWFVETKHGRPIQEDTAREIERKLKLLPLCLDLVNRPFRAGDGDALVLHSVDSSVQERLLNAFDNLHATQQEELLHAAEALAAANSVARQFTLTAKVHPPDNDRVGKFFPKAPSDKTGIRDGE